MMARTGMHGWGCRGYAARFSDLPLENDPMVVIALDPVR
jgi:hypothetical protein